MRQIGINLDAIDGISVEEYAKKVRELGFDVVFTQVAESLRAQEKIADVISANQLRYETIHAPFSHINDMWLDCEGGDKMIAELLFSVDACATVGAPILVVHLSSRDDAPSITDIGRARYERLVEYATKKGIIIAFENQRKLGNIGWAFDNFEKCENVGFCWDCGHEHCFTKGREYMPLFGKRLVCTHIHDNMCEYNRDLHMIPFDGRIDYTRFAELIKKYDYKGPLTLEVFAKCSNYYENVTPDEYLQRAADAIKKIRSMIE